MFKIYILKSVYNFDCCFDKLAKCDLSNDMVGLTQIKIDFFIDFCNNWYESLFGLIPLDG